VADSGGSDRARRGIGGLWRIAGVTCDDERGGLWWTVGVVIVQGEGSEGYGG
jgi:hypothetical protein